MRSNRFRIMGGLAAASVMAMPAAALAAPSMTVSPLVSLAMVASPQSQAALCGVAVSGTAAASATTATTSNQDRPGGCVLPVPDAAVAPLPGQAAVAQGGFSPFLIGLGAIGLGVLLFALLHGGDEAEPPPQPVSPA